MPTAVRSISGRGFAKAFGCLLALSTGCSASGGELALPATDPEVTPRVAPLAEAPTGPRPGIDGIEGFEGADGGELGAAGAWVGVAEAARFEHALGGAHPEGCLGCHQEGEPQAPLGEEERRLARASCAGCHDDAGAGVGEAPSAPQLALVEGRGSILTGPLGEGPHRHLEEGCASCHMALPELPLEASLAGRRSPLDRGGHTLDATLDERAGEGGAHVCAGCHGEALAPAEVGAGRLDLDGDGRVGRLDVEHRRALALFRERLFARIRARHIEGACGREAASLGAYRGRLLLKDEGGAWLGDCDADGRFEGGERGVEAADLPAPLAAAAHDLWLLSRDGSAGVHNALYVSAIFDALRQRLR